MAPSGSTRVNSMFMEKSYTAAKPYRILLTDLLVLAGVYLIPALSHLSPFPLYYLDPMRLLLMAAYLAARNPANALVMAVTIPLFSSAVAGHPPFYKALLIGVELLVNISLLHLMLRRLNWPVALRVFLSIVAAKTVYYAAKWLFVQTGLLQDKVIATGLDIQLLTAAAFSLLFALLYRRIKS